MNMNRSRPVDHDINSVFVVLYPLECENHAVCVASYRHRSPWLQSRKGATGNCLMKSGLKDSKEKQFPCPYCPRKYSLKGNLKNHILNAPEETEKRFSCEFCERKFRLQCFLNIHERKHDNDTPFSCKICDAKFKRANALTTHPNLHKGKVFSCQLCPKRCQSQRGLASTIIMDQSSRDR